MLPLTPTLLRLKRTGIRKFQRQAQFGGYTLVDVPLAFAAGEAIGEVVFDRADKVARLGQGKANDPSSSRAVRSAGRECYSATSLRAAGRRWTGSSTRACAETWTSPASGRRWPATLI